MMSRGLRILIMAILSVTAYLATIYIMSQTPIVAVFSGADGETKTEIFIVSKRFWDIRIKYFKAWSPFWSLKIEVYTEDGENVFYTSVSRFQTAKEHEWVELNSHPSLPPGKYYLKVYSKSVTWTLEVIELD